MNGSAVCSAVLLLIATPARPQDTRATDKPIFRAGVTRVEVSALVLDRDGTPVGGLTVADFEVLEDGVPQSIRSFAPFTYEHGLLVLPEPVIASTDASLPPASGPTSNFYASASRIFALILDDLHVDVRRTLVARAAARRLVEQLAPTDLLFVKATSSSQSTGFFGRDRKQALQMIDSFTGQRLLDKTIAGRRFPGRDFEPERLDRYQRLCATIRDVAVALRDVTGRRKTVVLLTEGSSFGAGFSDMQPGGTKVPSGSSRVMDEALAAAAAGNIAIYPLNPAGLDVADADLIQAPGLINRPLTADDYSSILAEARQSVEMARDFATLTGGVSLVDTNDALGGIDRVVRDASTHYVLTYEPETPVKASESRSIEVRVRRAGLTVLARRGYRVPVTRPPPPMSVPGGLPPEIRALLSGVLPTDALPMRVQAVPLARQGRTTTVAVIVEVNGPALASDRREGALLIEQGLVTVNATGRAANGVRRSIDAKLTPLQWEVLADTGLRSVWAIELPRGRHQLRVASIETGTGRGGSVYLDVEIPNDTTSMQGMLVASQFLAVMPTVFVDERLRGWTTPLPTTTRVFPDGDVLTVTVPHLGSAPVRARLVLSDGRVVWEGASTPVAGAAGVQFTVPLRDIGASVCDLVVDGSLGPMRATIGIVAPASDAGRAR